VVTPPPTSGFGRVIRDYLQEKRAGGASPKTIRIYGDALEGVLVPFAAQQGVTELSGVTSWLLNDLNVGLLDGSASRTGRPLSKATVHSYMRAINTFLAWAKEHGEKVNARAQLPSMRRRVLDTLSRDDVTRMEDCAATERDKLIVRVLADTGMRLSELLGLTTSDIRTEGGRNLLKIRGKGDRERLVPITPTLARRLCKLADKSRSESASERVFVGLRRSSDSGDYAPLTQSGVQQMISELGYAAGMTRRVHPHLFRHSMATDFLRRGGNPLLLQQILGHTSLAMITATYSHLTISDAHAELMRILTSEQTR
jgi:integrase/recombinase XerD